MCFEPSRSTDAGRNVAAAAASSQVDPDAARLAELVAALAAWFTENARPLPWRSGDTTPWGVLVSEILSHQTQIARVVPKWLEFMRRWPEPAALAADTDAAILEFWDRLGYPRRALQLRRCAIAICDQHNGRVPSDVAELSRLPGIGPYTAGAVASFAYGAAVPAIDTNVRRVLARAVVGEAIAWSPSAQNDADAFARIAPTLGAHTATWNASAMELGALVCQARVPKCAQCPVQRWCKWQLLGKPASLAPRRRTQATFKGSLREARGKVMALLRDTPEGATPDAIWRISSATTRTSSYVA